MARAGSWSKMCDMSFVCRWRKSRRQGHLQHCHWLALTDIHATARRVGNYSLIPLIKKMAAISRLRATTSSTDLFALALTTIARYHTGVSHYRVTRVTWYVFGYYKQITAVDVQSIKYMHVALADVANEAKKLGQSNNVQSPSKRFDKKCSRKKKWIEIFCFGPAEKRGGGGGW